jgi:hypothetical protein
MMRDALASRIMRTTLNIDDDVLMAAKEMGKRSRKSTGEVLSELAREALTHAHAPKAKESRPLYGFRPLPRVPGKILTNDMINKMRDEELV